jgi:hypothetical protein
LSRVKGWDAKKIGKYIKDINVLPSITQKVQILVKDVLGINYREEVYQAWARDVRGPRNAIMHGTERMYDQFKWKSALLARIASTDFILELLGSVPVDRYLTTLISEHEEQSREMRSILAEFA